MQLVVPTWKRSPGLLPYEVGLPAGDIRIPGVPIIVERVVAENDGDAIHAVMCRAGYNLRLILAHLRALVLLLTPMVLV